GAIAHTYSFPRRSVEVVLDVQRGKCHCQASGQLRKAQLPASHLLSDAVQVFIQIVFHVAHHSVSGTKVLKHNAPEHVVGQQSVSGNETAKHQAKLIDVTREIDCNFIHNNELPFVVLVHKRNQVVDLSHVPNVVHHD